MMELKELDLSQTALLEITYQLTECRVPSYVLQELNSIATVMRKEQVPILETPEAVVVLSQRETELHGFKLGTDGYRMMFNKFLLERLATLRGKRINKSKEVAKELIVSGL